MKKFRILLVLACTCLPLPSFALTDLSLSGQFNLLGTWKQLPSRDQGVVGVSIPSVRLDFTLPLQESNEVFIELESAEFRDASSSRYDTQVKEAYLILVSLFPSIEFRYGLVPNPWVQFERLEWDYDFWGPTSEVFLIRYKYSTWADLGIVAHGDLGVDWGEWVLSASNGEGNRSDEIGRRKEYQLILDIHKAAPFYVKLGVLHGAYETMDDAFNEKRRLMLELSYASPMTFAGLSFYSMADAADAMASLQMADSVDVLSLAGTNVEGQGVSLLARRKLTARTEFFARVDWLNPVKSQKDRTLQAVSAGLGFQSSADLLWVVAAESTTYSQAFSPSARDQSQILLATQVRF